MRAFIYTAGAAALIAASVACGSHSTAMTGSGARAMASSTAVQADEQAAARLVQPCLTAAHLATAKSCIEDKVPVAKRAALKQCLAKDVAAVPGMHAAAAKQAFKLGAQACVATALK